MATDEYYATREIDGVLVVVFRQAQILDAVTIERMAARLKELIDGSEADRMVCDFSHVTYLSSSALGMLIGLQRRITQKGGSMKLAGVNDEIREVFEITKLDTVFDMYRDVSAAVEAFRKNL